MDRVVHRNDIVVVSTRVHVDADGLAQRRTRGDDGGQVDRILHLVQTDQGCAPENTQARSQAQHWAAVFLVDRCDAFVLHISGFAIGSCWNHVHRDLPAQHSCIADIETVPGYR